MEYAPRKRRPHRRGKPAPKSSGPLGVSIEAVTLWRNGTPPETPPWRFATSLGEVGRIFDVAERTAAAWKAAGMPGRDEEFGVYDITAIHEWRFGNGGPSWHFMRNKYLADCSATGDLVRRVFNEYRHGLPTATAAAINEVQDHLAAHHGMTADQAEAVAALVAAAMAKHIGPLLLDDEQIEQRLERDWDYV